MHVTKSGKCVKVISKQSAGPLTVAMGSLEPYEVDLPA